MCGIGGNTIEAAQRNMSMPEFWVWQKFRNKRGSLHAGMRTEESIARLLAFYANSKTPAHAAKRYAEDFAPHMDERVVTIEELAGQMGALQNGN